MSRPQDVRDTVSKTYTRAVEQNPAANRSCCSGPAAQAVLTTLAGYSREALAGLPADAVVNSFGCGNPVALAAIREGDTVLDLGSGAGIDLLLAARLAGTKGRVIGVDMTSAMIERARANAAAAGFTNVEVLEGIIEDLPVDSESVDLVISNCVINLSPEKHRVFAEIYRVLRTDGRFSISDIVAAPMPESILKLDLLRSACISGAIPEDEYLDGLCKAGLVDVKVSDRLTYDSSQLAGLLDSETGGGCCCGSESLTKDQLGCVIEALAGKVASIRVVGRKPKEVIP